MGSIPRPPIFRIPLTQLIVLLPISLATWWLDTTLAYSIFLGGLIHLIPNTFFAQRAFRVQGASARYATMWSFSLGQTIKFLLTLLGFGMVFLLVKPLNVVAVFLSYIAVALIGLIAATLVLKP